jgi:hypothetical protein
VRRIAWLLPLGVLVQAVIGGITVLTGLRWWTVSVHFLASMVLIALAVAAVHALRADPSEPAAPRGLQHATTAIARSAFAVLLLGTFVTAAGPHGGDVNAPRIGIDIRLLAIAHADGVWLLLGTIVATLLLPGTSPAPAHPGAQRPPARLARAGGRRLPAVLAGHPARARLAAHRRGPAGVARRLHASGSSRTGPSCTPSPHERA